MSGREGSCEKLAFGALAVWAGLAGVAHANPRSVAVASARSPVSLIDSTPAGERSYDLKAEVAIPEVIEAPVEEMGRDFHARSGRRMVVTSGYRSPREQASAMYDDFAEGEVGKKYKANLQPYVREVLAVFNENRTGAQAQVVELMRAVVERQVAGGVYLSRHMTGYAIDLRVNDLAEEARNHLDAAARALGAAPLTENDHRHVQFSQAPPPAQAARPAAVVVIAKD